MFLNDWEEGGKSQMVKDFGIDESSIDGCNILLASYGYEDYEGDAFVLFEKDGVLFEVNGSHCSCYDLSEDQWQPEETTKAALQHRIDSGCRSSGNEYKSELQQIIYGLVI